MLHIKDSMYKKRFLKYNNETSGKSHFRQHTPTDLFEFLLLSDEVMVFYVNRRKLNVVWYDLMQFLKRRAC